MILLINKVLEFCLQLVGLGPFRRNTVGLSVLLSILLTSLPFQCWKLIELSSHPDLLMDSLGDVSAQILMFIKLFYMWKNKRYINQLLLQIYDEWNVKNLPEEWVNLAWYSRTFSSCDVAAYQITSLFYYLDILITYTLGNKPIEERRLMLAAKYPFNSQVSPVYEIITLMQYFQSSVLVIADSLGKTLLVVFVFHACVNIDKLKNYINDYSNNLSNSRTSKAVEDQCLKQVIKQHLKILTLVRNIDGIFSEMIFFQLLLSNILICMTVFVIITSIEATNVVLIIKFTFFTTLLFSQCFTFCFIGQYLRSKGELIAEMIYNVLWYNGDAKEIKAIVLILANSQMPLELSGKIFVLTMDTFTIIVKTSMSYLSVLRAMYT